MKRGARLGQHFLKAGWAARSLTRASRATPGDTILEIGPGRGALTRELLVTGAQVVAVEKDATLVEHLQKTFPSEIASGLLKIVAADIRNITPEQLGLKDGRYILAANIPYYITGEILRRFLTAHAQPKTIAVLIQKEVAQRITAKNSESILSLSVKAYGAPNIVKKVPRENFSPPPSVDSAILCISDISRRFFSELTEKEFFTVVRAGFASKRKVLANNLGVRFGKESVRGALAVCGIPEKARAEDVGLQQWECLVKSLREQ